MAENSDDSCLSKELTAIVIGAGPAGLTTALGLSKLCKNVILVEKRSEFTQTGATFGIAKNGRKALTEISEMLWDDMEATGIPLPSGGLMLPWWEMRDTILRRVLLTENIELVLGETFTEIHDQENGIQVQLTNGMKIEANFLVGADGVHSAVREWLGLTPALETGSTVFRGSLVVSDESSEALRALLNKGIVPMSPKEYEGIYFIVFNFNSKHPGRLVWVFSTTQELEEGTTPITLLKDLVVDPDELALLEEIFESSHEQHLKPFPATKVVDFSDEVLSSLDGGWGGRGHAILLGDAAHAMRPTDGQGGNLAFEDAAVLCRTIQNVTSVSEALKQFEATRLPRVKKIHDDQRIRYEMRMRGEAPGPMSQEFREWIEMGV